MNIKSVISSSIEKVLPLSQWVSHGVWRYVHPEHEETGVKSRKINQRREDSKNRLIHPVLNVDVEELLKMSPTFS